MIRRFFVVALLPLGLVACASTSNPPGPEGTGDHKVGYQLGLSDAVKQQYWVVQNEQKNLHPPSSRPSVTYLPITTGGTTNNGVATVPTTEYIPVQESK